jgi:hypothetical protein
MSEKELITPDMVSIARECRERELERTYSDKSIIQIDVTQEISIEDYEFTAKDAKFRERMKDLNITVKGKYSSHTEPVLLSCNVCTYEWETTPVAFKAKSCPVCRKIAKSIDIDKKLWERSGKIIKDKFGKVIRLSDFDPRITPTVRDKFVLVCENGHKFTTSHERLRRDRWCPICSKTYYGNKRSSNAIYGMKASSEEKQRRLSSVCEKKGAFLISNKGSDEKYTLSCKECKMEFRLNKRQMAEKLYICPKKCIKSFKVKLGMISGGDYTFEGF